MELLLFSVSSFNFLNSTNISARQINLDTKAWRDVGQVVNNLAGVHLLSRGPGALLRDTGACLNN